MSRPARFGFCTLRNAVIQTVGASSFMPRWNGSSFISALNSFRPASSSVVGMRRREWRRGARRHARQVGLEVQLEQRAQLLGVLVGRRAVVAVVDPEHRNVRLRLRGEVQNDGFVRTEIGRDDGAAAGLRDGPADDFERRLGRAARRSSG